MLKFWTFIFRRTGYKHSSICAAELEHLLLNMDYIEKKYLEILKEGPDEDGYMMSLDNIISLEIGLFQAHHDVAINGKHMIWRHEPWYKRCLIRLRRLFGL